MLAKCRGLAMLAKYRADIEMKILKCEKCYNIIDTNFPDKHFLSIGRICGACQTCGEMYLTPEELQGLLDDDVHLVLHDDLWSIEEIEDILTP